MARCGLATPDRAMCRTPIRLALLALILVPLAAAGQTRVVARGISGVATVKGASLYYEMRGEGKPVVLIHDGGLDRRMWDEQFERFSRAYKVIRYDVRGWGKSSEASAPFSSVGDLRGLLEALGVGRVSIVGLSLGGRIALDFALTYPAMVNALVVCGPGLSGFQWSEDETTRLAAIAEAAKTKGPSESAELWLKDPYLAPAMESPALAPRLRQLVMDNLRAFSGPEVPETVPDPPAAARLSEIRAPTLVIVGSRDVPDIQKIADLIVTGVAGAKKTVISGAGHLVNMEKPAAFDLAVLTFLGEPRVRKSEPG